MLFRLIVTFFFPIDHAESIQRVGPRKGVSVALGEFLDEFGGAFERLLKGGSRVRPTIHLIVNPAKLVPRQDQIREVARKILERFNYRVLVAADGAEAVATFVEHRSSIDVVLTDMAMPVMDGPATIAALRVLEPQLKIIGSSGLSSQGELSQTVGEALQGFIPKPYAAEVMLTTLADVLRGKSPVGA